MKRKGFTLVELLVVVAIIALLISILAPSLKSAKDLAKQVICMTNQRGIGTALGLYAEVNSGHMMYGYWLTDATKAPSYPNGICLAFSGDSTAVDPADGLLSDRRAFGWAYARGFLGPASMFYCPNISPEITTRGGGGQAKDYPQPWGSKPPTKGTLWTDNIRMTYAYNPHVKEIKFIYEPIMSRFPTDKALLCDLFFRDGLCGHRLSGIQWFMVYPDNHVGSVKASAAVEALLNDTAFDSAGIWGDYATLYSKIFE